MGMVLDNTLPLEGQGIPLPLTNGGQGIGTGTGLLPLTNGGQGVAMVPDNVLPLTNGGLGWGRQREIESTTSSTSRTFFFIVASCEVNIALQDR